ncbi:elongation of very long chain fatty acids protein [Acrasis kona]|uniref:Elongation of fatty acids protein n=1 Tax=Acrasis kona TaxID=1008807 RepID=A0AAW2ZNM5_9EUKA
MNFTSIPALDSVLQQYHERYASVYGPWWVSLKYPHILPWATVAVYVSMVFGMPKLMKAVGLEKGINVSPIMKVWNLFLSVWSAAMALGTGIPYIIFMYQEGFFTGLCDERKGLYEPSTMGMWANMFVASKYLELFDTFLLIAKTPTREVPFLHWYHHTTVLLFTWYAQLYSYTGAIFMVVNATVHTFMYWYYFRMECGHKPSWAFALTIGQISQMFVGIFVNGSWMFMRWYEGRNCPCTAPGIITAACAIMYASYAFLFLQFFFKRYYSAPTVRTEKKKQ